jgi:hypothetical protein
MEHPQPMVVHNLSSALYVLSCTGILEKKQEFGAKVVEIRDSSTPTWAFGFV